MKISPKWVMTSCMTLGLLGFSAASALAQANATLEIDGLSALYFEGAEVGSMIPSTSVPLEITRTGPNAWDLVVRAADFALPEIVYPSGKRVAWKLSADATGALSTSGGELVCQLVAPAIAYVDGSTDGIPMTLTFSTETLEASAKGLRAQRQGVRLDPSSGYLQLVTAAVNPLHAATAPGNPFFAVLSGRIVGFKFQ